MKNENFLAYFMGILNSWVVYKLQTINPGCLASPQHSFWWTAIRRDIRATLYFCSCDLHWCSTACVLLSCFNTLADILQLWAALS